MRPDNALGLERPGAVTMPPSATISVSSSLPDAAWVILCAALVFVMQAGYCCLETGLVRAKNVVNVAIKNIVDVCIAGALFWMIGHAFMFGDSYRGLIGTSGFFLDWGDDPGKAAIFVFQLAFCGRAITIISGAVAERMRFYGYLLTAISVATVVYPLVGHWAWSMADGEPTGWLNRRGFIDFAGATVVHSTGGWVALAAVLIIGPRLGRFGRRARTITSHNQPLAVIGAILIWFGWLGLNGGFTHGLTPAIPTIFGNTALAGAFGGITALGLGWMHHGRPRVVDVINGILAGLVAISASCHIMTAGCATVIAMIGAAISFVGNELLHRLEVDDAVGAVSVHCFAGVWGTLAVALMGDPATFGTGLGAWGQLKIQMLGAASCYAFAFSGGFIAMSLINRVLPLRVSASDERKGLNIVEHAASTEVFELLRQMHVHQRGARFVRHVDVEPHTEVGQIAEQYNVVLDRVVEESRRKEAMAEDLRLAKERVQWLHEITVAANEAPDLYHALSLAVGTICRHNGWQAGTTYALAPDGSALVVVDIEARAPAGEGTRPPAADLALLRLIDRSGVVTWLAGLPGPADDASGEQTRPGRLALPVRLGDAIVAVMSFVVPGACQPGKPMLNVLEQVAAQLAQVAERARAAHERSELVRQLLETSRQAGMAEVATGVLHNVGNILNSVNTSASEIARQVRSLRSADLARVARLVTEHADELGRFVEQDERGRLLPEFLEQLSRHLASEQAVMSEDVASLVKSVEHIKQIVSAQQSRATAMGVVEPVVMAELVDEALRVNADLIDTHGIEIERRLDPTVQATTDRHLVLQILTNLFSNAVHALTANGTRLRRITVTLAPVDDASVRVVVADNGMGIPSENLVKVFRHGFTTREGGHGFGLHASALAARQLGGDLSVVSAGADRGAAFTLEIPAAAPTPEEIA